LKLFVITFFLPFLPIREQDPLKQGLKQSISSILGLSIRLFASKIH